MNFQQVVGIESYFDPAVHLLSLADGLPRRFPDGHMYKHVFRVVVRCRYLFEP